MNALELIDKLAACNFECEAGPLSMNVDYTKLCAHAIELEQRVIELRSHHCTDCCCARSWKALGVHAYTGKSIPEHIETLRSHAEAMAKALEGFAPFRNGSVAAAAVAAYRSSSTVGEKQK